MRLRFAPALAALTLLLPCTAAASGAWRNYLRASAYADLLAEADTLWCATRDAGLLVYTPSSRTFTTISHEPNGLAMNRLTSITLDRSRRLWVGTNGKGVSVLSTDRSAWSLVNAFDGLPADSVTCLTPQGDSLWIGTTRGFGVWDGTQVSGVLPDGVNPSPFTNDKINGIVTLGDSVWIGTDDGVNVGRQSEELAHWTPANVGLVSRVVVSLVTDGTTPFALAGPAVYRWDTVQRSWSAVGSIGTVRSLSARRGDVFAGTSSGLYQWNGSGWTLLTSALTSNATSPFVATADESGRAYAAGRPSSAIDASKTGIYSEPAVAGPWSLDFPPGPPGNVLMNLEIVGPKVYVASFDQGIGRLEGEQWNYWFPGPIGTTDPTQFRRPVFNFGMLADRKDRLWVYSWAPLRSAGTQCVPDTGSLDVMNDSGAVPDIRHVPLGPTPSEARRSFGRASTLDPSGGIWFGMDSPCADQFNLAPAGLEYFREDTTYGGNFNSLTPGVSGMLSDQVWSLATSRDGRVWLGTNRGVMWFNPADTLDFVDGHGVRTSTLSLHSLEDTKAYIVRGLAVYGDTLWVSTSSGLRRYDTSGDYRGNCDIVSPPSPSALRPMDLGRDGTLWLGTGGGLSAYHPGQGCNSVDFSTANSPLADDDVRTVRVDPRTGFVWIATAGGISRFDPGYVPSTASPPALDVTIYPNPARITGIGVALRLEGNAASYQGAIYDIVGRRVHTFTVPANGHIVWNGRDDRGDLVRPGIYFVRAVAGTSSAVARIVLVR